MQSYLDTMVICRWIDYPDPFLTSTCNPRWPEIKYLLHEVGHTNNDSQVQAMCKVFTIKLNELLHDLKHKQYFNKTVASEPA